MQYFLDTSALVKRYVIESGSRWIGSLFHHPDQAVLISQLSLIEIVSALTKRKRMGDFPEEQVAFLQNQFFNHCKGYQILVIDKEVTRTAIELLNKSALKAYDAVQLGTALMAQKNLIKREISLTFVCADNALCQVAQSEGLPVKNPNETEGD